MTISVGSTLSQPKTELNESNIDRVTSNLGNKIREGVETESATETATTLLLSVASNLASLASTAMQAGDIRSDKVEQLRQAISAGTYKVDPGQVADSMIDEWAQPRRP